MNDEKEVKTVPLAYHEVCMTRDAKTVVSLAVCWLVSMVLLFTGVFAYFHLHDTRALPADGYSIVDPTGKVVSSGITSDEIEIVIDVLNRERNNAPES